MTAPLNFQGEKMKTSKLEKTYPELKGLPYDVQSKILEKAEDEIKKEGKTLFWGIKLVLVSVLIAVIVYSVLYFTFGGYKKVAVLGSFIGVMILIVLVNNRNIKLFQPKVRGLVKKEKI